MKPKIKVKDIAKALQGIETDRQLTKEIVEDALKEALTKAYRKHIEIPDAYVRVDIINDTIHIYNERMVVEEVQEVSRVISSVQYPVRGIEHLFVCSLDTNPADSLPGRWRNPCQRLYGMGRNAGQHQGSGNQQPVLLHPGVHRGA